MTITFFPARLRGIAEGIPSKSCMHRLLIGAALAGTPCEIPCRLFSKDMAATLRTVPALYPEGRPALDGRYDGARILLTRSDRNPCPDAPAPAAEARFGEQVSGMAASLAGGGMIDVGESGSTFRFVLPVLAALGREAVLTGAGRLAARPISPLYELLVDHGAVLSEKGRFPLRVGGRLRGGRYTLPGNISSQYISGLMMALPLCREDSEIFVEGRLQSRPYAVMTAALLTRFGIRMEETETGWRIPGGQCYALTAPGGPLSGNAEGELPVLLCENDYSNAAFFLTAGALSDDETGVSGLCAPSLQGDAAIEELLARFGASVRREGDVLLCRGPRLRGTVIDASDIPDLVPVLALVASAAEGTTVIGGVSRLRFKESDRLATVSGTLNALGADVTAEDDRLVIRGRSRLCGGQADSANDHRIAMMAAVASLVCSGPVTVTGFEAVEKSYPGFLRDFAALGGVYRITDGQ